MPRNRNPVGIAVGKLILAIQKECDEVTDEPDAAFARKVLGRAHTLLQASRTASVPDLLSGGSVADYLGADWIERHPCVKPGIDTLMTELAVDRSWPAAVK